MPEQCPYYPKCLDRRVSDAEWKGEVKNTLINLTEDIGEIKEYVIKDNDKINKLYFKVGGLSVGVAILIEIVFKISGH